MSTPVKRKITLELNPNKKVLPKDRPSVFQRLGTKKFPQPGGGAASSSSSVPSAAASGITGQESTINKEEIVKRIVGCDEPPEPVPPPKIVPESVSAHARLIEAQLAAKLGKVIVSRGETIGALPLPVPPVSSSVSVSGRKEPERKSEAVRAERGGHSSSTAGDRGDRGGGGAGSSSKGPSGGGGGEGWDQSSLENADQDILERKRKELQHELKLEMDASGGGGGGGGGSGHHHHHHHSSSSSSALKQKVLAKETLTVVKKVRKVPVPRRRSTSSSDSSSSSGSDSSDSDSSSSSSSSSRDSRRVKKRTIRQRRGSSSSSDGGPGTKKVIKKHVKKVSADGTKRIITKKVGGHLTTKIRVKKVTSPGGTSHIRKVRDVSPGGKVPTKYTVKKVVAVQKKDKHTVVVDARERVREKEREMALLRKRELAMKEKVPRKSRSPRSHIRSRSPRSRMSPGSSRGREVLKKKSPEPPPRYREPPAKVIRRPERSPERLDDRRRHESLKDREHRERQERELARNKEREEALARCQERQRERERLAAAKERERALPPPVASSSSSGSGARGRDGDGGLEKPDRHRPVERLLPRPAERARALAAARSPGKPDHDRSRTPNSPRNRDRAPRDRSYDRAAPVERGYVDHHDRRSRSREREYSHPQTIVRGARARDSPYERHPAPTPPARESRDYRDTDRSVGTGGGGGYERDRGRGGHDYGGRNDYPDDPPPRRDHDREWGDRDTDRGHPPPPPRSFDRRGTEEHGSWDRDHHPPQHSHGPHDQEPYQGSSRNWEETRWKEADGWVNEKERSDWKYKEQRQWEHDEHPAVGPGPGHTHTHGGGGRGGGRWQQSGHPDQNQGSNWHGKPKEDMDFTPRHKLAGRLGEVGDRGGMFRRHTHQGPGHQGPPMGYHHDRKVGGHMGGGGMGGPGGRGGSRFGGPNKYSINRTQQNLANQQLQQQHQHQHHQGPPHPPQSPQHQMGSNQGPPMQQQHPGQQQPCAGIPAGPNAQPGMTPAPVLAAEGKEDVPPISEQQPAPATPVAGPEGTPTVTPVVENQPSQVVPPPNATVTDDSTPVERLPEAIDSATPADPTAVPATDPAEAAIGEKPAEPAAAAVAEPMDEDNLSEISDDPDDILTREEEISQLNDTLGAADKPASSGRAAADHGAPSGELAPGAAQDASDSAAAPSSSELSLPQEPKDSKEAGKLQANKELKEEMDLDFEEISDGELEEENKFKGLGDALGVDWASLAQETRAKLKPEQTIPVSARNRWKAHHILLDIGISVRLAGESYAQRVLTESKEKLREEIQEFKAAAQQQKVAAVKREEEEQQLFNGVKIKKEVLDEDEQKAAAEKEQAVKQEAEKAAAADEEESTEQEANLAEMDKILHPVASVHVAMRERARARRNLILRAAGPYSRALSARRDLEIRRQLCGFPPQECNERITEHQQAAAAGAAGTTGAANGSSDLHETVMKLFQATMQPNNKIEVQ